MSSTPKILIVDDEPRMCDSLKMLLSRHGYAIQTVNGGQKAIEYMTQRTFDLVLLNIVMPDMNGYQVMDHMARQSVDTLVIIITGYASTESAVQALRRGACDYLRKPFEYEELLGAIKKVLDKKRIEDRKQAKEAFNKHKEYFANLIRQHTIKLSKSNKNLIRRVKKLKMRTHELLLINQLGELLQVCASEAETYSVVISICRQLFPSDSGYLSILDDLHKVFRVVGSWGVGLPSEKEFAPNQCWGFRLGKVYFVKNPKVDILCPHLKAFPNYGYLCAPISTQGKVSGMIHLFMGSKDLGLSDKQREYVLESKRKLIISVVERYSLNLTNLRLCENLRIQSIYDPLTGLYNRRYMEESLQREERRAERRGTSVGIIMIDIDHFKVFNDKYGHETGDVVLYKLGSFLKNCTRGEDIVCRYGGEEFTLIMPETSLENARKRAEELGKSVREDLRITHKGKFHHITISLGVAAFPEHGPTAKDVVKAADTALYQAKARGRDRAVVALS